MKIGIAGLGKMGINHLNELRKDDEFKVAALYDLRQNAEFKEPFYTKLDEFLKANLDIVIIATPTSTHLELAKAILAKVKCVLIEKPLAMNLKEMNEIKELAKKHENSVAVGFSERFNPAILALKKELANEKISDIISRGKLPIIAGGTGLYIDSLLNNVKFSETKKPNHRIVTGFIS